MPISTEATKSKITPPALARMYGVGVHKVLGWIRRGELKAINAAVNQHGRPRFLIDLADVADFEQRRAAAGVQSA